MINRRLLRIKVLQILYAHLKASREKTLDMLDKELLFSAEKSHDVYVMVFKLLAEMGLYAQSRAEQIHNRHIKNDSERLQYLSLANNRVLTLLSKSKNLDAYKVAWIDSSSLVREYTETLIASDEFKTYRTKNSSLENDKDIVIWFLAELFFENEKMLDYLEEHSLYWNDELDSIVTMNVRTIERIDNQTADISIQKIFKDDEVKDFARRLLRKSVFNFNENNVTLQKFLVGWDIERIAEVDMLILQLALTEAIECASIPTKVTLDEFIEITKMYSTEKSPGFVNGILNVMFKELQAEGKIIKAGRGLVE